MVTTTTQIKDLLLPGLNAVFGEMPQFPQQWSEIFDQFTSDMQYERDVEVKLLGQAQLRAEGAATSFEDMGERYLYVYKHVGLALGFVMTKFAIRDNLYKKQFGPSTKALRNSMMQTREVYGAAVLNNATDTTNYPGGDAVSLLNISHPIDTGTVANTLTVQSQLNETALQDILVLIRRFRDAAGLRSMLKAEKLIVPPELQWIAERIMTTPLRVGTSDNDINAIRQRNAVPGGFVINDFLSNVNSWYLKTNAEHGLKYFDRDPLETDMFVDFTTDNLMVKATQRYSFGWSNFRGLAGCMP